MKSLDSLNKIFITIILGMIALFMLGTGVWFIYAQGSSYIHHRRVVIEEQKKEEIEEFISYLDDKYITVVLELAIVNRDYQWRSEVYKSLNEVSHDKKEFERRKELAEENVSKIALNPYGVNKDDLVWK